jgi:hypothetical protein
MSIKMNIPAKKNLSAKPPGLREVIFLFEGKKARED